MPTIRTEIKILAVLGFWALFAIGYFSRFALPAFSIKLYGIVCAGVLFLSAYGFGSLFMRGVRREDLNSSEHAVLSIGVGMGTLSFLLFFLGAFSLWQRLPMIGLVLVGLLAALAHRDRLYAIFGAESVVPAGWVPLAIIALSATLGLLIAFTPPTYYDTLVYHYALPQQYLAAGRWVGLSSLIYPAFPQVMELLWLLGIQIAGDTLANLLGLGFAVVGVCGVYLYCKRYLDITSARWASALLLGMPSYLLLSSGGYIDVGLTVFGFLSFYALMLWKDIRSNTLIMVSGLLAGCALGSKYTGGVAVGLGTLFLIKEGLRENTKIAIRQVFLYAFSALLVFLPWMAKNLHFVGNPLFPFFYSWSLNGLNPWLQGAAQGYFNGLTEYAPRSVFGLFSLLWEIAVGGFQFGGGMDVLGDLGWGVLFGFLPVLVLSKRIPEAVKICLAYAGLFFIPWGLSRPVLRFLLPITPFLAIATGYSLSLLGQQPRLFRNSARCFLALLLVSNFALFFEAADSLDLFQVPLGAESRDHFLARRIKYYPAAQFINGLPEDTMTYVVGDQCSYYYNRPVLVTPVFNKNPLTTWANDSQTADDLRSRLKEQGFTHVLVNRTEMERMDRAYHLFPWTPRGRTNWEKLLKRNAPLYADTHCDVYAL